jgi:hypothetical protein
VRPARKADNLKAICEPIVWRKCGRLDVSQSYGPTRSVTGITLLFYLVEPGISESQAAEGLKPHNTPHSLGLDSVDGFGIT